MRSLIRYLGILAVGVSLFLCANSLAIGGPETWPIVDDFSNTLEWSGLTSNKSGASFTTSNGIATLSYAPSVDGYALVYAWLWMDTDNYSGIKINVTSLAPDCLWGFRMDLIYSGGDSTVYTGKGTGPVFIPYPQDVAYMGDVVPVMCALFLVNPGQANPSISIDSISLADPWENDISGILDRLADIEKALSMPGASGVARFGKDK